MACAVVLNHDSFKKLAEIVFHTKYFSNFVSILIAVMGCKS